MVWGKLQPDPGSSEAISFAVDLFLFETRERGFYPHCGYWVKTLGKGMDGVSPRHLQVQCLLWSKCSSHWYTHNSWGKPDQPIHKWEFRGPERVCQ